VAVTEGDKVEAERILGWSVNTWGIGDLIARVAAVTESEVDLQMDAYHEAYTFPDSLTVEQIDAVRYQARVQAALAAFLKEGGFGAFTDTFQDLQQLEQLPGLAVQDLMRQGYGFGAEGDWKVAAMDAVMKKMGAGLPGGTAFMEDYSYHMDPANPGILGAHMLEVDPDIAADKPRVEVHPLGIGDRNPPARLCFSTGAGDAILASLVDMGGRMRLIVNDCKAAAPFRDMPNLPVARVMWKPLPDLATSAEAWMLAGGAHHTVLSYDVSAGMMRDWARIMGVEFVHIHKGSCPEQLERELFLADLAWKLK